MMNTSEHRELMTYPVDNSGAATFTVMTATPGKRWVIYGMTLRASAAMSVQILSGATAVTGPLAITFTAAGMISFENAGGEALIVGRDGGDTLDLTQSAAGDLDGWITVGELQAG
jgi:hypothetical protein